MNTENSERDIARRDTKPGDVLETEAGDALKTDRKLITEEDVRPPSANCEVWSDRKRRKKELNLALNAKLLETKAALAKNKVE